MAEAVKQSPVAAQRIPALTGGAVPDRVGVAPDRRVAARLQAGRDSEPMTPGPGSAPKEIAAGGQIDVGPDLERLIESPGAGTPMEPGVRARIEPILAADLGVVRVHTGPDSAQAAVQLQARAFTVGANIFLGDGESPSNLALMAHEATHVVQQAAVEVYREFSIGGLAMGAVHEAAQEIPGYSLLAQLAGKDPITGDAAKADRQSFIQDLLTHGPFAGAIGPAMGALGVLDDVFTLIETRRAQHNLTFARLAGDMAAAWAEVDLLEGIDYNVAIVGPYIDALIADVVAFVSAIVDDVLAAARAAAADVAEPLLESAETKPYWDLAVKVFHHDPLRDVDVDAPTTEILGDFLRLIGQEAAFAQMQARGTLASTAAWLDTQFARFGALLGRASQLFADAWAAISPENLPNLIASIESLADQAVTLIKDVAAFAQDVLSQVLALIKMSLLGWLADHANHVPGFQLLTVILGRNPFTGDAVEQSAEKLIGGFITLLPGGEAMYAELSQSGVIAEAGGRIEGELTRLKITWELITGTFAGIWDGLSLEDLVAPVAAFDRIVDQFGDPLRRIRDFVATVIGVVVELILKLMNFPAELLGRIVDNTMAAIDDIERDPIGFLKNVVGAMKAGFEGFFSRVFDYLLTGLTDWLFRGLRALGVQPPASITLESVIGLVVSVLGISVEMLWTKLGQKIGAEAVTQMRGAIDRLGEAWAFIKDVTERGISAIWEFISGQLGNLWDTILQAASDWIMKEIVDKVTAKLLSMLDPTGIMAIINGTVAFFKAIQSALEYLREILQIIDGYVSTLASVARGQVAASAAMLERGLGSAVPVAIGFLANQAGLSNVPEKIKEIIEGLRGLIEQALDWLFDQAIRLGKSALAALGFGDEKSSATPEHDEQVRLGLVALESGEAVASTEGRLTHLAALSIATAVKRDHSVFSSLEVVDGGTTWDFRYVASPSEVKAGKAKAETGLSAEERVLVEEAIRQQAACEQYRTATIAAAEKSDAEILKGKSFASGGGKNALSGWASSIADPQLEAQQRMLSFGMLADYHKSLGLLGRIPSDMLPDPESLELEEWNPSPQPISAKQPLSKDERAQRRGERDQALALAAAEGARVLALHPFDAGAPGRYELSHGERQILELTNSQAIGITPIAMCDRCQKWFSAQADSRKKVIAVSEPGGLTRVFRPGQAEPIVV